MFKVELKDSNVNEKAYDFQNDRGERVFGTKRTQSGWLHMPGKPYPTEVEIKLQAVQPAYPAGLYLVSPDSFRVYQGRLELSRLVLVPAPARGA